MPINRSDIFCANCRALTGGWTAQPVWVMSIYEAIQTVDPLIAECRVALRESLHVAQAAPATAEALNTMKAPLSRD
jgi:hypothetical protein